MKNVSSVVLAVLVVIITLIMAPLLLSANDDILTANLTNLTGLTQVAGIGPLIMLIGLLTSAGLFTWSGVKGKGTAGRGDMIKVVGSVIILVVALIMFGIVISSTNTLITAVAGSEGNVTALSTIVGILPLIMYVGIIAGAGFVQYRAHKRVRASRRTHR